jgi:hypothetical protein
MITKQTFILLVSTVHAKNTLMLVSLISSNRNGTARNIISANLHMAPTSSDPFQEHSRKLPSSS